MPKLNEVLWGKKDKIKKAKLTTPEQEQINALITEGLTKGEGAFADIFGSFNEDEFNKGVTQPALKNFTENVLPQLQEKFIAGNQVGGSGMRNAGVKAGVDLQSQLAKLMYEAQQGQKQNKIAGVNILQGKNNYENIYKQGSGKGLVQGVAEGLSEGVGKAATAAVAG